MMLIDKVIAVLLFSLLVWILLSGCAVKHDPCNDNSTSNWVKARMELKCNKNLGERND